ncbi:hypothetical protein AVEN_181234-1 [Araneus ventricosus]|uniref:Uncharacterized protein n=1 Tax=Araneus ventricosus TaxID=182803 RepID=A0A4Y2UTM3_ARAVE|nr:hypothetical protein AVEN_181234-1 [Araneus ventricosus]
MFSGNIDLTKLIRDYQTKGHSPPIVSSVFLESQSSPTFGSGYWNAYKSPENYHDRKINTHEIDKDGENIRRAALELGQC